MAAVDELDRVVARQPLELDPRVGITEDIRALLLAALEIGVRVIRLAVDVVLARTGARAGDTRPDELADRAAGDRAGDRERDDEHASLHVFAP